MNLLNNHLKKRSKTLLAGVVYKGVEKYLENYFHSIINQTDKDFDLLIVNNGLSNTFLKKYYDLFKKITIKQKNSFGLVRNKIIEYGYLNNYSFLIFTDTDDYFSENRVEKTKKYLLQYDFVFNKIVVVNEVSDIINFDFYFNKINDFEITDPKIILEKNIIGLSNSAVNLDVLLAIKIPDNIIAVDWFLFTCILLNSGKGRFIQDCTTYYRQHSLNITGAKNFFSAKSLMHGIKVKTLHYIKVIEFCKKNGLNNFEMKYKTELNNIIELNGKLDNKSFLQHYLETINKNYDKIYSGWWSEILTLEKFNKYAN